jgi:hypothetical protein
LGTTENVSKGRTKHRRVGAIICQQVASTVMLPFYCAQFKVETGGDIGRYTTVQLHVGLLVMSGFRVQQDILEDDKHVP